MREEWLRAQVDGYLLHRLVIHPKAEIPVRADAIFYHGQGDYAERYLEVLHPFADRGIRCTITELPGHGLSPGRRGHAGDTHLLDTIIKDSLSTIKARGSLPYGVMGHSMGGLLAARHLVLAGQGTFPVPDFAWLSSPLVKPGNGREGFFLKIVALLAPLMPAMTFSTRVRSEVCRAKAVDENAFKDTEDQKPPKHPLWHSRISLGWGIALMDFANLVRGHTGDIPIDTPLLFTQGGEDPVCPPALARELFELLPSRDKRYVELEGVLHEPFRGEGSESLYAALEDWLDSLDL